MRAFISLIHSHQLSLPQRAMHLALSLLLHGQAAGEACKEVQSARWSHACGGVGGMRFISMEKPGLFTHVPNHYSGANPSVSSLLTRSQHECCASH